MRKPTHDGSNVRVTLGIRNHRVVDIMKSLETSGPPTAFGSTASADKRVFGVSAFQKATLI